MGVIFRLYSVCLATKILQLQLERSRLDHLEWNWWLEESHLNIRNTFLYIIWGIEYGLLLMYYIFIYISLTHMSQIDVSHITISVSYTFTNQLCFPFLYTYNLFHKDTYNTQTHTHLYKAHTLALTRIHLSLL